MPRCFDGDLPSLPASDRDLLTAARDRVGGVAPLAVRSGSLAVPIGDCEEIVPRRKAAGEP